MTVLWKRLPLAALAAAMAALGGARAVGGALLMSTADARHALSRGAPEARAFDRAAARARLSAALWSPDPRAWDALGALSLQAAAQASARFGARADAAPAIGAFSRAARRAPGQPLYWMRRAAAQHACGREAEAARDLQASMTAGPFHPQALHFRFALGRALWPALPADLRAAVAVNGAGAARQGREGMRAVARRLRDAPPDLRSGVFLSLSPAERPALVGAMRRR